MVEIRTHPLTLLSDLGFPSADIPNDSIIGHGPEGVHAIRQSQERAAAAAGLDGRFSSDLPNDPIAEQLIMGSSGQKYNKIVKPGDCILVDIVLDERSRLPSKPMEAWTSETPTHAIDRNSSSHQDKDAAATRQEDVADRKVVQDLTKKQKAPGVAAMDSRAKLLAGSEVRDSASPPVTASSSVNLRESETSISTDKSKGSHSTIGVDGVVSVVNRFPTMVDLSESKVTEETGTTHEKARSYYSALHRAGPRATLHFVPTDVTAAIVTCGGLCPGLNAVIHHIVQTLWHNYGVRQIMGVRGGYHGMSRFGDSDDFYSELFSCEDRDFASARETKKAEEETVEQDESAPTDSAPSAASVKKKAPLAKSNSTDSIKSNAKKEEIRERVARKKSSRLPEELSQGAFLRKSNASSAGGAATPPEGRETEASPNRRTFMTTRTTSTGQQLSPRGVNTTRAAMHGNEFRPIALTPESIADIQHLGGTILGSSRGGFDIDAISKFIRKNKINLLFIAGGDGTHRGIDKIAKFCIEQRVNCAVCGIPKTIDNDIGLIDRSFGFWTAVEEAKKAIQAAKVEASSNMPNGIGIVKLMGRSAGFISVFATISMGSGVDLCLIPEVAVQLDGERGCLPHLRRVLEKKGHAVVVVAEGAGEELMQSTCTGATDKSGNKVLPKIGEFMTARIKEYFSSTSSTDALGNAVPPKEVTIKYIDPSYMIRSVGPNVLDSYDCMVLSSGAVHGAMAGITGFSVGMVNNHSCLIPIPLLEKLSPRTLNAKGRTWERVLAITQQP
ncbi:unnamed protein product [Amoebophrya sp. A120]|nr:unnamed protein product [Amoebophrya sp. A120]|eukprot:GSA120T00006343001.1